jgi:hypothetical protein
MKASVTNTDASTIEKETARDRCGNEESRSVGGSDVGFVRLFFCAAWSSSAKHATVKFGLRPRKSA